MPDIRQVHQRSLRGFQVALEEAASAYRQSEYNGDIDGCAAAAQQMAGLKASMDALNAMARDAMNPQAAAAPTNQHGLNASESEVAKLAGISDEEYARNKAKLWDLRNRGQYPMPGQA